MAVLNLNGILTGMQKAIEAVVKENPAISMGSVRDRIAEDKAKIDQIAHGHDGSSKEMQEAAWSLAVVSLVYFLLVQAAIASFQNSDPSVNGTVH
jgi:hypothetical protein